MTKMKKIEIELTEVEFLRLLAYTKADNYSMGDPEYRTHEEIAAYLVALMTERGNTPFIVNDDDALKVYDRELRKLKRKAKI